MQRAAILISLVEPPCQDRRTTCDMYLSSFQPPERHRWPRRVRGKVLGLWRRLLVEMANFGICVGVEESVRLSVPVWADACTLLCQIDRWRVMAHDGHDA